jgi:multidrug efflux system membrane fusion protein
MDNRVDPNTGSMWMRGEFVEPQRPIPPGIFARVQFPLGGPYQAVLVPEQALGTDQGQKFLFVVGEKDGKAVAQYRPVEQGPLQSDGWRVIRKGITPGEAVVVGGLQRVRDGAPITPEAEEAKDDAKAGAAREPSPARRKEAGS